MKKKMFLILFALCACLSSSILFAGCDNNPPESTPMVWTDEQGLQFYPINDETCAVSISNASYSESVVVIPPVFNNLTVTKVVPDRTISTISTIILPNTIIEIVGDAFINDSLETITIPNSVKVISDRAFLGCYQLEEVFIESYEIYQSIQSKTSAGYVIERAKRIYVPNTIINNYANTFLESETYAKQNITKNGINYCLFVPV